MLAADKADLRTSLAVNVLQIREKEMQYYIQNMSTISTQATLLATLTFGILVNFEWAWPDDGYLSQDAMIAIGAEAPGSVCISGCGGVGGWRWDDWIHQTLQLAFLISTTICIFTQLWTVQGCNIAAVMGQGLALRGKDESVERAMHHIALQCNDAYHMFSVGLTLLAASSVLFMLSSFAPAATVPASLVAGVIFKKQRTHTADLVHAFQLGPEELVSSAFTDLRSIRKQIRREKLARQQSRMTKRSSLLEASTRVTRAGRSVLAKTFGRTRMSGGRRFSTASSTMAEKTKIGRRFDGIDRFVPNVAAVPSVTIDPRLDGKSTATTTKNTVDALIRKSQAPMGEPSTASSLPSLQHASSFDTDFEESDSKLSLEQTRKLTALQALVRGSSARRGLTRRRVELLQHAHNLFAPFHGMLDGLACRLSGGHTDTPAATQEAAQEADSAAAGVLELRDVGRGGFGAARAAGASAAIESSFPPAASGGSPALAASAPGDGRPGLLESCLAELPKLPDSVARAGERCLVQLGVDDPIPEPAPARCGPGHACAHASTVSFATSSDTGRPDMSGGLSGLRATMADGGALRGLRTPRPVLKSDVSRLPPRLPGPRVSFSDRDSDEDSRAASSRQAGAPSASASGNAPSPSPPHWGELAWLQAQMRKLESAVEFKRI